MTTPPPPKRIDHNARVVLFIIIIRSHHRAPRREAKVKSRAVPELIAYVVITLIYRGIRTGTDPRQRPGGEGREPTILSQHRYNDIIYTHFVLGFKNVILMRLIKFKRQNPNVFSHRAVTKRSIVRSTFWVDSSTKHWASTARICQAMLLRSWT